VKYQVIYQRKKKNKVSQQKAVFYTIEDAVRWEKYVMNEGYVNSEIIPIFN